ncbi:hypothetical protein FRC05_002962 [Tulasnella sp. 425]|nr:hypothetical protein FRC05_002962 [Tulasnella sp. 425]
MDLGSVLAKFTALGPIETRADLDTALEELLAIIAASRDEIPLLLDILVNNTQGLLEAVLTSDGHNAYMFRNRVTKALRKSLATSTPIFRACADRLGSFLMSIPPSIGLDRSVMRDYNAYTTITTVLDSAEAEYNVAKTSNLGPVSPTKAGKWESRHARTNSINRISSTNATFELNPPSSSGPSASSNLSKLLTTFLENFFTTCINTEIEGFAVDGLFETLTPKNPHIPAGTAPNSSASPTLATSSVDYAPGVSSSKPGASAQLHYLSIKQEDIVKYLNHASKPTSGNWPVVVSQRGIKRLREFVYDQKEVFLRIEKKIRQLCVGFFPPQNQTSLFHKDSGIPIYTADLGDCLRLIYHIDFGAPTSATDKESQFIRVFGVFHESEVDVKFWGSVAAQLGRRGPEYIERCNERRETRIRFKGVETTPPKLSTPLDVSQWNKEGADIEIDESHFLELHRVLALEKFVPLSRTFFEAIQRFDEHSFMFAVSSSEYRIITHPSSCLVLGRSGTGKTTCMLFRMAVLDMDSKESQRPTRQMFVTQSRTLASKVRQYWTKLVQTETNEAGVGPGVSMPGLSLIDIDETAEDIGGLPSKFSELEDSHFPIFLTYDQVSIADTSPDIRLLLEEDYGLQFDPLTNITAFRAFRGARQQRAIRQPLVSFEYFELNIWPRFDEGTKKGLHPILVYSEFMGVIKGSEASRSYPKHYLDRQAYESQSSRTHFGDTTERSRIYTLFEAYLKLRPPSSYDVADRVHSLLSEVEERGLPGKPVDYLYVDEAQDHLILDAALLRRVCPNPDGLFFAGDTAQTISVGSTFRFSELKAFLYRLERDDELVKRGSRKPVNPQFFQLSTNYRSHSGIVKSAAYLVRLIISYFGQCIDSLTPEASLVDISAHKPIFFLRREDQNDFRRLISDETSGKIELGAHQVIIVRDEIAAQKLREVVGRVAVLAKEWSLTIDSLATATDWRAILHAEHRGKPFDEKRHAILRTELKALYVGLTRARERVWIWDRSDKGADLETLLTALNLATVHDITGAMPRLGVTSSAHEWSQRAQQYFSKRLFSEAALAFKNANMGWWESVAMAYGERQSTMRLPQHHFRRQSSFTTVAQEFERLAESPEGVDNPTTRNHLYLNSGECYVAVSNHGAAANAFMNGKRYTEAAYHYRMANSFEKAVEVIKHHHVDPEVAESITYTAKIVYTKRGDASSLRKARDLFGSREDFMEFLEDHGFEEQRITFLESLAEYERIGDIHRAGGNYISAIRQFHRANTPSSHRKATACLLEGLRANISFAIGYGKYSKQVSQLFELSQAAELTQDEENEVDLLRAVSELDLVRLREHGLRCISSGNTIHALLALDCWASSDVFRTFASASDTEAAEVLTTCLKFSVAVNALVRIPKVLDKPAARNLFCITGAKTTGLMHSETVSIKRHSFIYDSLNETVSNRKGTVNQPTPVRQPRKTVEDEIRRVVWNRLNGVISHIDALARESRAYELCIPFLTTGRCVEVEQELCWRDHPPVAELTVHKFNSRFRLTILTITLLNQPVYGRWDEHKVGRAMKQRAWLDRLFKLCFPSTNQTGNLSDVVSSLIPEYKEAMKSVNSCLSTVFQGLRPSNGPQDFLNTIMRTALLASAFDYTSAASYFKRGQWALDTDIAIRHGLIIPTTKRPLVGEALPWFLKDIPARTKLGVSFLEGVVGGDVWLDVDVAIAFVEEVCAQLILNQEAHRAGGRHCSTMPRSWIIRAFTRGVSRQANGSIPEHLVSLLGKFIRVLLLREHKVLSIFKGMGNACSDIQLYTSCLAWVEVVEAMKSTSSSLDELISVHWKEDTIDEHGLRTIFCSDDQALLQELSLISTRTTSASQVTLAQEQPNSPSSPLVPVSEMEGQQTPEAGVDDRPVQSSDDAELLDKSAKTIQAFFRRHQTPQDNPLWAAFMELVDRRIQTTTLDPPSRLLLLCLRGPLPHVVEFLERFTDLVRGEVSTFAKLAVKKDENQEAMYQKQVELRRIRNKAIKLIEELRPPSTFYFGGKAKSAASVFDIVEKVKATHGLVQTFRPFMEIPGDIDYELGVEPLLSDRVPWTQAGVASGVSGRR